MSLTIFLALCTLGSDFLLVVLFQWVYGEKRRLRRIRVLCGTPPGKGRAQHSPRSPYSAPPFAPRSSFSLPAATYSTSASWTPSRSREQLAYRRNAASFATTRSHS